LKQYVISKSNLVFSTLCSLKSPAAFFIEIFLAWITVSSHFLDVT
jgi:hypothetical protein